MTGHRTRMEANAFWQKVQEMNAGPLTRKKAPEGASCKTCVRFRGGRCLFKKKAVKPYNVCGDWKNE